MASGVTGAGFITLAGTLAASTPFLKPTETNFVFGAVARPLNELLVEAGAPAIRLATDPSQYIQQLAFGKGEANLQPFPQTHPEIDWGLPAGWSRAKIRSSPAWR